VKTKKKSKNRKKTILLLDNTAKLNPKNLKTDVLIKNINLLKKLVKSKLMLKKR
jgi:hypothetical protein